MEDNILKRYIFYLLRWQASTPILALVLIALSSYNQWVATIIANLIGGLIFFWVDKVIFDLGLLHPLWEIKENIICRDCNRVCRGYRLVKTKNYDRLKDNHPEFRCERCSRNKLEELNKRGVMVEQ